MDSRLRGNDTKEKEYAHLKDDKLRKKSDAPSGPSPNLLSFNLLHFKFRR